MVLMGASESSLFLKWNYDGFQYPFGDIPTFLSSIVFFALSKIHTVVTVLYVCICRCMHTSTFQGVVFELRGLLDGTPCDPFGPQ